MPNKLSQEELEGILTAATNFPHVHNDWNVVVTDHPIKSVQYISERTLMTKLKLAFSMVKSSSVFKDNIFRRVQSAISFLLSENKEMPDATVWHGNIVTFWMEHAEYIATVSPTSIESALTELAESRAKEQMLRELMPKLSQKAQKDIQKILDSTPDVNNKDFKKWDRLVSILPHKEAEAQRRANGE